MLRNNTDVPNKVRQVNPGVQSPALTRARGRKPRRTRSGAPLNQDFPFAASEVAILTDYGPIPKPNDHAADNVAVWTLASSHSRSTEGCGRRLPTTRRSTNQPLAGSVMFLALSRYSTTLQQRRRYTKPPNPLQDRYEQLTLHRDFGHLERHVLGVPNDFRTDLDQSRRAGIPEVVRQGE